MAVKSKKYKDRPLLGRVKEVGTDIVIEWFMGSYSGTWKEWRGRSGGKAVTYTDSIPRKDIVHRDITFTSAMHLPAAVASTLKTKYQ